MTSILHLHRRALSQNLRQLSSYVEPASLESNATNTIPKPSTFVQDEPHHENPYTSDHFIRRWMVRKIPHDVLTQIDPDLVRFGDRVRSDIWRLGQRLTCSSPAIVMQATLDLRCESEPPILKSSTTAWGKKQQTLITSSAWKNQKRIAAEEGLVSIPYEGKFAEFDRIYQAIKLLLYAPASGLYSCPLAMTDGAVKTLLSADQNIPDVKDAIHRLTSRDPDTFWTSGQWMTEKKGGSDVSGGTESVATPIRSDPGYYSLVGYKWFSSATDSDMALTLGRMPTTGSLSLFLLQTRDPLTRELNGIELIKLKDKLGTRQLPTAELILNGARARIIGDEGRGIATISNMLTITRLHNIISSVAIQHKMTSLAKDYSQRRWAFSKPISQHPLHLSTLMKMTVDLRGCTVLLLDLARQQGLEDKGIIGDEDKYLLRLMMPVAKMYTAKKAVANASEGIESFGGQGYIEETGIPGFLRDAQVLPIWEGTSNVMALDVMRALTKTKGEALRVFRNRILSILRSASTTQKTSSKETPASDPNITATCQSIKSAIHNLIDFVSNNQSEVTVMEYAGRDFAVSLAHIYIGALLLEQAIATQNSSDSVVARNWTLTRDMCPVMTMHKCNMYRLQKGNDSYDLVFEGYVPQDTIVP